MTGDNWNEETTFCGFGSAVIMVVSTSDCPAKNYEFMIDCLGLDCYSRLVPMVVYLWDKRPAEKARDYFQSHFTKGSFWKLSGRVDFEGDHLVFTDPVYMPYDGDAQKLFKTAIE